ncbi:hypothetical protein [Streptomyces sp. NPDC005385]|uniref:hypothetical protein n=1 Tax=Streptomyces sp. NPDC005385 TaxID=3157039 RepID=UPI0033AB6654
MTGHWTDAVVSGYAMRTVRDRWAPVWDENTDETLAEWMLSNPYTGPARAHSPHDDWVHYPNGYLKIRYVDTVLPTIGEVMAMELTPADMRSALRTPMEYIKSMATKEKYGVRYVVPAEVFSSVEGLQAFIAQRVSEFIDNRESYLMTDGKYHQGETNV